MKSSLLCIIVLFFFCRVLFGDVHYAASIDWQIRGDSRYTQTLSENSEIKVIPVENVRRFTFFDLKTQSNTLGARLRVPYFFDSVCYTLIPLEPLYFKGGRFFKLIIYGLNRDMEGGILIESGGNVFELMTGPLDFRGWRSVVISLHQGLEDVVVKEIRLYLSPQEDFSESQIFYLYSLGME